MKKIMMSVVSIVALSSLSVAGGGVAPPPLPPEIIVDDSSLYVGLGYSYMNINDQWSHDNGGDDDLNGNALTVLAGYNFNKYIAVEGRYSVVLGDMTAQFSDGSPDQDIDSELSNIGLYLKPMYPIGELTLYGLLGFGQVTLESPVTSTEYSESGFQWGLGASYAVNENIGVFVDYTRLYDDTAFDGESLANDFIFDSITVGVTYTF